LWDKGGVRAYSLAPCGSGSPGKGRKYLLLFHPGGAVEFFHEFLWKIHSLGAKGMGKGQIHDKGMSALGIPATAIEFFYVAGFL
jgi:hypothetical protein